LCTRLPAASQPSPAADLGRCRSSHTINKLIRSGDTKICERSTGRSEGPRVGYFAAGCPCACHSSRRRTGESSCLLITAAAPQLRAAAGSRQGSSVEIRTTTGARALALILRVSSMPCSPPGSRATHHPIAIGSPPKPHTLNRRGGWGAILHSRSAERQALQSHCQPGLELGGAADPSPASAHSPRGPFLSSGAPGALRLIWSGASCGPSPRQ